MQIGYLADFQEHIPVLAEWINTEWSYVNPNRKVEQVIFQLQNQLNYTNLPMTFIGLVDDKPVAVATLTLYDMDTHPDIPFWLSAVYVNPEYRNQGLGKKLTDWCTRKAELMGVDKLHLATPDKADWYAKFGWELVEEADYHGIMVKVMNKKLNDEMNPYLDPKYNPFENMAELNPMAHDPMNGISMPGEGIDPFANFPNNPFANMPHNVFAEPQSNPFADLPQGNPFAELFGEMMSEKDKGKIIT